jgi:Papain-like cysteine protease AvrRpt2
MASFGSVPIASTPVLDRLRITLPLSSELARRAAREPTEPVILPYTTYFQRRSNWCWAAVAVSVTRFYDPRSTVTQCEIANQVLGRDDCCIGGTGPERCNVQTTLSAGLASVGRDFGREPADPDVARRLLAQQQPVGIFIRWSPTAGHFAALIGFTASPAGAEFVVADPKYGNRLVLEAELLGGQYRGSGAWTNLYRTAGAR